MGARDKSKALEFYQREERPPPFSVEKDGAPAPAHRAARGVAPVEGRGDGCPILRAAKGGGRSGNSDEEFQ